SRAAALTAGERDVPLPDRRGPGFALVLEELFGLYRQRVGPPVAVARGARFPPFDLRDADEGERVRVSLPFPLLGRRVAGGSQEDPHHEDGPPDPCVHDRASPGSWFDLNEGLHGIRHATPPAVQLGDLKKVSAVGPSEEKELPCKTSPPSPG